MTTTYTPAQLVDLVTSLIFDNTTGEVTVPAMVTVLLAIIGNLGRGGDGLATAAYVQAMENYQPGSAAMVEQGRPPDPSNPINILLEFAPYVTPNSVLEIYFTQVTGLDMAIIRPLAAQIVV